MRGAREAQRTDNYTHKKIPPPPKPTLLLRLGPLERTNTPTLIVRQQRSRLQERRLIDRPSRLLVEITGPCLRGRLIAGFAALDSAAGPSIRRRGGRTETRREERKARRDASSRQNASRGSRRGAFQSSCGRQSQQPKLPSYVLPLRTNTGKKAASTAGQFVS